MSKALAIKADSFLKPEERFEFIFAPPYMRSNPLHNQLFLLDRKGPNGCDPDTPSVEPEEYLQLLPYNVIFDPDKKKIFCYTRGKEGAEKGLHGLCSIGIGGHAEILTTGNISNVADALAIDVTRELLEEIGIPVDLNNTCILAEKYLKGDFYLIYDGREDGNLNVGRRHLGIANVLLFSSSLVSTNSEIGVIDRGSWIGVDELRAKTQSGEIKLESWSGIVFNNLFRG